MEYDSSPIEGAENLFGAFSAAIVPWKPCFDPLAGRLSPLSEIHGVFPSMHVSRIRSGLQESSARLFNVTGMLNNLSF